MRVRRAPQTRQELLPEGEAVVVKASADDAVVLNPLGAVIWDLCDGALTAAQIVDLLSERFPDHGRAAIARDVETFLAQLLAVGLVEELPAPCSADSSTP